MVGVKDSNDFVDIFVYKMLFLDPQTPLYCQRRVYKSLCSMTMQPDKAKLEGVKRINGANQSKAMQFSRYVQYHYSKSQPVPPDLCQGGSIQNKSYVQPDRVECANPIFSKTWTSKTNHCSCILGNNTIVS